MQRRLDNAGNSGPANPLRQCGRDQHFVAIRLLNSLSYRCPTIVLMQAILYPLQDIAHHVIKTKSPSAPDAAEARQLFIVAAGARADVERCQPLFDSLGKKPFVIGTDPGHANLVKLFGNMMTATTLEMLGEVVAVARKRGLDPKPFLDIIDKHDVRRAGAQNLRR